MFRSILAASCISLLLTTSLHAQFSPDHDQTQPSTTNGNPASGGIVIFPPYTPPNTEFIPPGSTATFPTFNIPVSAFPYNVN